MGTELKPLITHFPISYCWVDRKVAKILFFLLMQFGLNSMKVWMLSWLIISLNRFCACKYVEGTLKTREVCDIYLIKHKY